MSLAKILLCLDTDPQPSVFDAVVAIDAGADHLLRHGNIGPDDVRNLIYGAMFTRGPADLMNTAVIIGGADVAAGEVLLKRVRECFFGPMRVSVMLDSNGSNTTAVAAVAKIEQALGDLQGKRAVILAGTGPVGQRAAGLLAKDGAQVLITSRKAEQGERARRAIAERFQVEVEMHTMASPAEAGAVLEGAEILLSSGPAGVLMVPKAAWTAVKSLKIAVDLNAVEPLGLEGIALNDAGKERDGVSCYGAFGVGNFKTKLHKACVAKLFTRNDLVLDVEAIADVARELRAASKE
jgi:hypothetical protein